MAKLIHDVLSPGTLKRLPSSDILIAALYTRGVTIKQIFGKYYEFDAHGEARNDELFGNDEDGNHGTRLTVADAALVSGRLLPPTPSVRQPF